MLTMSFAVKLMMMGWAMDEVIKTMVMR